MPDRGTEAVELARLLRSRMEQRLAADLLPWDGQWLDRAAIDAAIQAARRRARWTVVELLLVIVLMGGASLLFLSLTRLLAY